MDEERVIVKNIPDKGNSPVKAQNEFKQLGLYAEYPSGFLFG